MLYKGDLGIHMILLNVYEHLKQDYDFPLVIGGYPGDGKSHFILNLFESWYKIILKKEIKISMIDQISQDYEQWLRKFKELQPYDMNVFDEGTRSLDAKDFMKKVSKDLNKLSDVFRCKKFLWVVVLPNYFRLNKTLREDRVRSLIWINKRGQYKFYTKTGLKYLNGYNEGKNIKNMNLARPFHVSTCPEYKGILREAYEKQKAEGVESVLDEVISNLGDSSKKHNQTTAEVYKDEVKKLREEGLKVREIADKLELSVGTVQKCVTIARVENMERETKK